MEKFLDNLDWSGDPFIHNDDIYNYFKEKRDKDNDEYKQWEDNFKKKYEEDESFKNNWDSLIDKDLSNLDINNDKNLASRILGSNIEIKNINDPETNNKDWIFLFLTPAIFETHLSETLEIGRAHV